MFGAQPFTQKLLMFEEFGPEKLDPAAAGRHPPSRRPAWERRRSRTPST